MVDLHILIINICPTCIESSLQMLNVTICRAKAVMLNIRDVVMFDVDSADDNGNSNVDLNDLLRHASSISPINLYTPCSPTVTSSRPETN